MHRLIKKNNRQIKALGRRHQKHRRHHKLTLNRLNRELLAVRRKENNIPAGRPGSAGARGAPGIEGATGSEGRVGDPGVTGPIGPSDGPPGPPGPTGSPGPHGGPIGPTGAHGADGADGKVGPDGPTGPSQGPVGPVGPTGEDGKMGVTGPQGLGVTGPQGSHGLTGEDGKMGVTGAQGLGVTGAQGLMGMTGPTGPAGSIPEIGSITISGPSKAVQGELTTDYTASISGKAPNLSYKWTGFSGVIFSAPFAKITKITFPVTDGQTTPPTSSVDNTVTVEITDLGVWDSPKEATFSVAVRAVRPSDQNSKFFTTTSATSPTESNEDFGFDQPLTSMTRANFAMQFDDGLYASIADMEKWVKDSGLPKDWVVTTESASPPDNAGADAYLVLTHPTGAELPYATGMLSTSGGAIRLRKPPVDMWNWTSNVGNDESPSSFPVLYDNVEFVNENWKYSFTLDSAADGNATLKFAEKETGDPWTKVSDIDIALRNNKTGVYMNKDEFKKYLVEPQKWDVNNSPWDNGNSGFLNICSSGTSDGSLGLLAQGFPEDYSLYLPQESNWSWSSMDRGDVEPITKTGITKTVFNE